MTKLLLVEDDNNLREIYEARLQAEGYTIVSAHDGEEALVVAKAEKPDLIISDVMMPKISGFEMLDILRNTDGLRDVKVIMLTALGQSDDQQRADRLGADRYLVKSQVTLEDIVKVAHDLLGDTGEAAQSDTALAAGSATASPDSPAAPTPAATEPAASPTPAPATVSEPAIAVEPPVSVDPEPTAGPVPTPITVSDDSSTSDAAPTPKSSTGSDTSSAAATSTSTEEAAVDAQIEDFVAGATETATPQSDTTTPAPDAPLATPPTDTEPSTAPETPELPAETSATPAPEIPIATPPAEDNATTTAADDKLVSDAADTLEANTKAAENEAIATDDSSDLPQPKKVGGERVIEPIEGEPKKDLDALLAIEEAKESQGSAQAAAASPVIVDDKMGPQAPTPPQPGPVDPNNIAL
jgi:CheY-like chemotaxis protein